MEPLVPIYKAETPELPELPAQRAGPRPSRLPPREPRLAPEDCPNSLPINDPKKDAKVAPTPSRRTSTPASLFKLRLGFLPSLAAMTATPSGSSRAPTVDSMSNLLDEHLIEDFLEHRKTTLDALRFGSDPLSPRRVGGNFAAGHSAPTPKPWKEPLAARRFNSDPAPARAPRMGPASSWGGSPHRAPSPEGMQAQSSAAGSTKSEGPAGAQHAPLSAKGLFEWSKNMPRLTRASKKVTPSP